MLLFRRSFLAFGFSGFLVPFAGHRGIAAVFTLEPFHATGRVHQFLLAGIERMAVGTKLDADIVDRGAGFKLITTGAARLYGVIRGDEYLFSWLSTDLPNFINSIF